MTLSADISWYTEVAVAAAAVGAGINLRLVTSHTTISLVASHTTNVDQLTEEGKNGHIQIVTLKPPGPVSFFAQ